MGPRRPAVAGISHLIAPILHPPTGPVAAAGLGETAGKDGRRPGGGGSSPPPQRDWNHARGGGGGGSGGGEDDLDLQDMPVVIEPSSAAISGRGWDRSPGRNGNGAGNGYRGHHDREQRYSGPAEVGGGAGFGGPGGFDGPDRGSGPRYGGGGIGGGGVFRDDSRSRGAAPPSNRYSLDAPPQQQRGGEGGGRASTTHVVGRESWELRGGRGQYSGNNGGQHHGHGGAPPSGGWSGNNPGGGGGGMPTHRISHSRREDSRNAPPRYHDHAAGNGPPPNLARHHYPMNGGPFGGSQRDRPRRSDRSRSRSKERAYNVNGGGPRDLSPPGRERFGGPPRGGPAGRGGGLGGGHPPPSYRRFSPGPAFDRGIDRRGPRSDRRSLGRAPPRRTGGGSGYGYGRYPGGGGGGVSPRRENFHGPPPPMKYAGDYRNGGGGGGGGPGGGRDMRFMGGGGGGGGRGYADFAMVNRREQQPPPQDYRRDESGRRGARGMRGGWGGGGGGRQLGRSSGRRGGGRNGGRGDSGGGDHSGGPDDEGHYKGKKGDMIGNRYKVLGDVGLGTFGRVVECWDMKRRRQVAVKVVRKVTKYHESALIEAQILQDVNVRERNSRRVNNSADSSLCVEMFNQLEHQGHCCLVFECLGRSLYDYLKKNDYRGFPVSVLRPIAQELLQAVEFLHSIKLIHTDLKPENVLLKSWDDMDVTLDSGDVIRVPVNPHIKVIDFGGATYEYDSHASVVNTRQYRAPEVILGLRWLYPSDLWSVGCIITELFLGDLLFATHNNLEHLALMEKCVGTFPPGMLDKAPRTRDFFDESTGACRGVTECDAENRRHIRRMKRLDEITAPVKSTGMGDLLKSLLTLEPKARATATEALRHRFFADNL
eukprot:g10078.t1